MTTDTTKQIASAVLKALKEGLWELHECQAKAEGDMIVPQRAALKSKRYGFIAEVTLGTLTLTFEHRGMRVFLQSTSAEDLAAYYAALEKATPKITKGEMARVMVQLLNAEATP